MNKVPSSGRASLLRQPTCVETAILGVAFVLLLASGFKGHIFDLMCVHDGNSDDERFAEVLKDNGVPEDRIARVLEIREEMKLECHNLANGYGVEEIAQKNHPHWMENEHTWFRMVQDPSIRPILEEEMRSHRRHMLIALSSKALRLVDGGAILMGLADCDEETGKIDYGMDINACTDAGHYLFSPDWRREYRAEE